MKEKFQPTGRMLEELTIRYPVLEVCKDQIWDGFTMLREAYQRGGCLYVAGNGGSAADCEHIVGELMKSFQLKRPVDPWMEKRVVELFQEEGVGLLEGLEGGFPAVSLPSFIGVSTATTNDVNGDMIFAQALYSISRKEDVFLAISTSGNSRNVIYALMVAKARGVETIGLTGERKCKMDDLCDVVIHVPERETYKIQELHLPVYHTLCAMLEQEFFGAGGV